jgi:hypothetical protein
MGQTRRGRTERPKEPASGPPPLTESALTEKREALDKRLVDGSQKIADAEAENRDVSSWEAFWLTLLAEYESVCDDLAKERTTW